MKNNKITLKKFWYSREEKANQLLKAFDKFGENWFSGDSYLKFNFWNNYKEHTCYDNRNGVLI